MLSLGSNLHDTPVMSLQTGGMLARALRPIIDPATLRILAYEVEGPLLAERPAFLRINEIRELGPIGMIIDSTDELITTGDVIKIDQLQKLNFNLVGLNVIDEHKRKLGKVADYSLDTSDFVIRQLHINRGIFKSLANTELLIHRSQIIEINDTTVTVKSAAKKQANPVMEAVRHDYVNPFRAQNAQPESRSTN